MALVFPSSDPSSSISLDFHRPLLDKEVIDVAALLFLFRDRLVNPGKRDVRF